MEGTEMAKQERKSMLYDEFDKFTSEPLESIHSYYLRYAKLINDMNTIPKSMTLMQINTKFVNHLQPEWSRFVTAAKQARDLHSVTFDQFSLYCSKYPPTSNQLRTSSNPRTQATIQNGQVMVQNVQGRHSQGYAGNARNNQAPGVWVINAVGNTWANQPRVIRCYNYKGEGHIAKQFTTRKRVKYSEWFKDKMLLAQAQEVGVADHVDAYDSDCDDEATTNSIFMENLSLVGSLNNDTVAPRYDSDTLSEVPHYDTYHNSDVLNSNIQELGYIENIVSTNESYDELKGNSDDISYTDYMLTIRDDADNYVPPPVQKDDMMFSVIEQMKSQVEKYNKVNEESKSEIELLTSELERYKDRVKVLGYAVKDGPSEQEAYLNHKLYTVINDRNIKNFKTLKQESSEKYEKNISEIMDLENAKKKLENIVFKVGQSTQTMHMLTKPQIFYDETHKTALGYQNPLYLTQARQKQPALYNTVLTKEHIHVFVCDSEETLILAEESRLKMLKKQTIVNTKLIDYYKLNKLYEIFVPQTQLLGEQLYCSSIPSPPVTISKPKVFPKILSSTSEVLRNLNKARDLFTMFDECIKRRTMLYPHQIGSREQSDIKGALKKDVILKRIYY
ncbi:hypothetical protein Tco_1130864 [Tanacetum coccineum]